MKIYGIGTESHECYGHGDFGTEVTIRGMGGYGAGPFPPCFTTENAANLWIFQNKEHFFSKPVVVPMELLE